VSKIKVWNLKVIIAAKEIEVKLGRPPPPVDEKSPPNYWVFAKVRGHSNKFI